MTLAIVAAGTGTRLQSEGISTPKPLIRINGTPIIDRIIKTAVENSADNVLCIINENSTELKEHLNAADYKVPLKVFVRNTASSLHSLYEMRFELGHDFILTTGDTIFGKKDFISFVEYAKSHNDFDVLLSVTSFFEDDKPLCVELDSTDNILSFHNEKDHHMWATGGVYYFNMNMKDQLETAVDSGKDRLRNFFRMLLDQKTKMKAFKFGRIVDVDHIQDITLAEELISGSMIND